MADALSSELGISDLTTFTDCVRHDAAAVLEVLESEACRAAAAATSVMDAERVAERAAQLAQVDARAAEVERRQAEAEAKSAAALSKI